MRKHRISDADAAALLKGQAPAARPELERLAASVEEFRAAAFATPPAPSAELLARLDPSRVSGISASAASAADVVTIGAQATATSGDAPNRRKVKQMFSWFLGLGLAAKIGLGTAVAAAAVTGAGVAGVLPGDVQEAFDTVVSVVEPVTDPASDPTVDPTAEPTADPTDEPNVFDPETETFGEWVSERAHDKDKNGREFGQETSEIAQHKGDKPGDTDDESTTDDGSDSDDSNRGPDNNRGGNNGGNKGGHNN